MKLVSTIFILSVFLLANCTREEDVSPAAPGDDKTLLGVIETAEGHRVSFHEYAPGSLGTLATYPADNSDDFSTEIQTLLGSGLTEVEQYKRLAKDNINEQYLKNIEAAVARLVELRSKQKSAEFQTGKEQRSKATAALPLLPWCPFPLEYSQIKCKTAPSGPGTLPLATWYPSVQKDFRVRLYIYPDTGGGYLRVDRRDCGYEYCGGGGAPVFDLTKLNNNGVAQFIDFNLNNATPDSYYFRGEGFSTASYDGSKIHMGVGVDKITLF